ncbi:hypothetical protein PM082_000662 [Marasmius tenuissimus]|nr:hypothetical protein PM082_000662 [Marasmius tenuissimus]
MKVLRGQSPRHLFPRGGVGVPVAKQGSDTTVNVSMRDGANLKKFWGMETRNPRVSIWWLMTGVVCYSARNWDLFVMLDLSMVLLKDLVLRGSFRYGPGDYALTIALASQGKVDVKPLITHRYPFTSALEAFQAVQSGEKGLVKAIIAGPGVNVEENQRVGDRHLIRLPLSHCDPAGA